MLDPLNLPLAIPYDLAAFGIGYLFGSLPFGLLLTRLAGTADIRKLGSGNIGATNVLRTGRKGLAAGTLLGDILKGTAAVVLLHRLWGQDYAVIAAFGAFLGHLFPVWLRFKGGKGVATYLGILFGLALTQSSFVPPLAFAVVWLSVAALTRYSSVAALTAAALTPAVLWAVDDRVEAQLFVVLTVLVFVMHRENIARLIAGTESKIGGTARAATES